MDKPTEGYHSTMDCIHGAYQLLLQAQRQLQQPPVPIVPHPMEDRIGSADLDANAEAAVVQIVKAIVLLDKAARAIE